MERLRHELLIVHGKCEAQEEVIAELRSQLAKARNEKAVIELEFSEYRKRTQVPEGCGWLLTGVTLLPFLFNPALSLCLTPLSLYCF